MTRSLARELGEYNIAINSIAPGLTLTEATASVAPGRHKLYVEGRAIQRPQVPEDITGAVVFLLSDDADFITGQLLPVNGGFVFL
jgi:NAD(P)-dependent dehydrogenase (short-subunit alcohol dehydrogenase family)